MQKFKEQLAQDAKHLEGKDEPVAEDEPPPASPGMKWVPHGDHWHEVPIDAPDRWEDVLQEETLEQPPQVIVSNDINTSVPDRLKYTGPPTYAAYEKWLTEAWKSIERNEFGFPKSPLPATPTGLTFRTFEESQKASELWSQLLDAEDVRILDAEKRMDAYYTTKLREINNE